MQKKKMQKKKKDIKSGEGDASMDDVVTLEGKFKVGTSKTPSDSGALVAEFLAWGWQQFNFPITATVYASDEAWR
jgi:hypothetical protein